MGYAIKTLRAIERQAKANEGQLAEIRQSGEQTKQLIAHAEKQATASVTAALAAKASVNALINSERAWVLIEMPRQPQFRPNPNAQDFLWISPIVKNHGRTPARITRIISKALLVPDIRGLPPEPEYSQGRCVILEIEILLPTGVPFEQCPLLVIGSDFKDMLAKKSFLYVYGLVDYVDVSGNSRQTKFCYAYFIYEGPGPHVAGFMVTANAPPAYTIDVHLI